nr:MAG TPA: hypothetical protein [Caudoviricetes sp.]
MIEHDCCYFFKRKIDDDTPNFFQRDQIPRLLRSFLVSLLIGGRYRYLYRRTIFLCRKKTGGDVPDIQEMVVLRFTRHNHTPYFRGHCCEPPSPHGLLLLY